MENNKSVTLFIMIIIITTILALGFFSMAMAEEQTAHVAGDITLTPTDPGKVTLTPTDPGKVTLTPTVPGQKVTKTPYYPPDRVVPGGDGNFELILFFVFLAGILFFRLVVQLLQNNAIKR